MPTIQNARKIFEQQDHDANVVSSLITKYPYKEFGLEQDQEDGALVVTLPNGLKIRFMQSTIEYYSQVAGGQADYKDDYVSVLERIRSVEGESDVNKNAAAVKYATRYFSQIEYRPEKYSVLSFILGIDGITVESIKKIYDAFGKEDKDGLSKGELTNYADALEYSLEYYKFLVGMLTVID